MKNIFYLVSILLFGSITMSVAQTKSTIKDKTDNVTKVMVYYFHATSRCPTCISIETNTQKVLDTYFKTEVEKGIIKYVVLDSDENKNKAICEKYEAFGSSLHIIKIANKKESDTDLTNFAFLNSKNDPEKFMKGVKDKITEALK